METTKTTLGLESFEYHPESSTYRAQLDREATTASVGIVSAIANVLREDPIELPPLQQIVDTDALDVLAELRETAKGAVETSFSYEEHTITVTSDGRVTISPLQHYGFADGSDTRTQ